MKLIKFLMIIITAYVFFSCNKSENPGTSKEAAEQKKPETKEFVKLTKQAIKDIKLEITEVIERELTGEIIAPAKLLTNQDLEAYVGSMLQGRVSKVFVNIGNHVKKGQTLMLIEGLQIGELKAQFLKAKANLNYSEASYNRLKSLIDQNIGSQKSYLESKAEFEKAKAEFYAEDKKIHSIGLSDKDIESTNENYEHNSGSLAIKSPIDGMIAERNVVIGQLVEPNSNSFRIINTSTLLADAQIYENDLLKISGKPDVIIKSSALPENSFPGKIIYIGDIIDKESRTIKVRATISNSQKKLKPEMFVEMLIPIGKATKGLVVPSESVFKDGKDYFVFVATSDTTFEKKAIQPGSSQGEFIEIIKGIQKGERIVSKGSFLLKSELKKESNEEEGI